LAAFAGAGNAHAQLSSSGGPIAYSADNLEYKDNERQLVLTGDVDVTQNDARLRADKLTLYFKEGGQSGAAGGVGSGDIDRIVAEGQVFYIRPQTKARGDHAVYVTDQDQVTFTGNVVVASDDNVIRGNTLVLQISAGTTTIKPDAGKRVQGVFRPKAGAKKNPSRS
jgi:lipopolysaccharide export system protein LptA